MSSKLITVRFSQVNYGEMFVYRGDSSWIKQRMSGNQSIHNAYRTNFMVKGHRRGEVYKQFSDNDLVQVLEV